MKVSKKDLEKNNLELTIELDQNEITNDNIFDNWSDPLKL